jgi:hypothetical protein
LRESPEVEEVLVTAELDHCSKLIKHLAPLRDLPITVTYFPFGAGAEILERPSRRLDEAMYIELQRKPEALFSEAEDGPAWIPRRNRPRLPPD